MMVPGDAGYDSNKFEEGLTMKLFNLFKKSPNPKRDIEIDDKLYFTAKYDVRKNWPTEKTCYEQDGKKHFDFCVN
jgi:hypothetical protein